MEAGPAVTAPSMLSKSAAALAGAAEPALNWFTRHVGLPLAW